ncbi:MAG: hypothetical protein JXM70_12140 [Pirellulales bacterium]|nr:hypothetical protein [Pirellulales bacterium]
MSTITQNKPTDRTANKLSRNDDGMRKAAILVSALDRDTVDALLDQMGPAQASIVRQAVIELDDIDADEQQQVIEEFFRLGPGLPQRKTVDAGVGVELDEQLAERLAARSAATPAQSPVSMRPSKSMQPGAPSFDFLNETESDRLANIFLAERPQTIALVLSHMPPERAGQVLVKLPAATQVEVVRRLVDLEETDPEILREVEQELQQRLSQQIHMERRRVAGVPAVAGILEASDSDVGSTILNNLAARDRRLAQKFAANLHHMEPTFDERFNQRPQPVRVDFTDLAAMDADTLYTIVETVRPEILVLSLLGAPSQIMDRVLRQMPKSGAAAVRHEIENIGPVRLGDVEEARRRMVETVEQLHAAGKIKLQVGRREASIGLTA